MRAKLKDDLERWGNRINRGWTTPTQGQDWQTANAQATYVLAGTILTIGKAIVEQLFNLEDTIRRNCS